MQIDAIDLYHLSIPLTTTLPTRFGPMQFFETVLVKMQSGKVHGWGEAAVGAAPTEETQWAGGVYAVLKRWMAPALVQKDLPTGESLQEELKPLVGNSFAKGALDIAWWDLNAKLKKKPLHQLLGSQSAEIQTGVTIDPHHYGDDAEEILLSQIEKALADGHRHVNLKACEQWNLEMIRMVNQMIGTDKIRIDFDGHRSTTELHLDFFNRLEDFQLEHVEQPLPAGDLVGLSMLQENIQTPICLDQSFDSLENVELALDMNSCRAFNLQPDRAGGLTVAIEMSRMIDDEEEGCEVGIGWRTDVGFQAALTLASLPGFSGSLEYPVNLDLLGQAVTIPAAVNNSENPNIHTISPNQSAGLGVQVNSSFLKSTTLAHDRIEAPAETK